MNPAIDMHAHWVPRGLLRAAEHGKAWYGWEALGAGTPREFLVRGGRRRPFPLARASLLDPAGRSALRQAEQGIGTEALLIAAPLWDHGLDAAASARFCRELNDELAEVQHADPEHFRGVAVLPLEDRQAALRELERATAGLGLRAVVFPSNVGGRDLDDPEIMAVLEEAVQLGLAIFVHPTLWDAAEQPRFSRYLFLNSFGAPTESSLAAMSVVYGGLLDRRPQARILFTQGGGWIHFGVGRFGLRYRQRPEAAPMRHPPADYLSLLYYDCLVHDDDALALLMRRAGVARVCVGTDYPIGGDIEGGAAPWVRSRNYLTAAEKRAMLWANATEFLGLAPSPLEAVVQGDLNARQGGG